MNKYITFAVVAVLALVAFSPKAEAKRFTGSVGSPNIVGQYVDMSDVPVMSREVVRKKLIGNTIVQDMAAKLLEEDRPMFFFMVVRAGIRY